MSEHGLTTDEIRASFAAGYDLERELLGGGMSRVFLATERALGRKVVIKVLPPELAAGVNKERFRREVQLAAQLQHPHIVPLYSAGAQGEVLFYTMPFIEGESLKHALQEKKRFSPREVLRVLHDVVDALGYAHARGVIHRDIKPGNVLRSGKHSVVTDFGVAKALSASIHSAPGMTTSGMVVGSPAYMAPEQLAGDPNADHRVDLYAVGLLAYELLTGDTPFQASSPQETLAAQLTRIPAPIDKVRRDVPPALSAIIMRCLQKRPEDRWADATELLAALDALSVPSGEFAASGRSRPSWGIAAAAGIVIVAAVVWNQVRPPRAPAPVGRDTVTISPAGPLLTRAESLAIAKAVDARMTEQRVARRATDSARRANSPGTNAAAPGAITPDALKRMADSIRDEIQRAVFDSLGRTQQGLLGSRAGRGGSGRGEPRVQIESRSATSATRIIAGLAPELDSLLRMAELAGRTRVGPLDPINFARRIGNLGPPRRVVVTEPRISSRSLEPAGPYGAQLADALRNAIGSSRYVIVNPDSVKLALEKTRTIDDLRVMLNADLFANITVMRARADSVIWQVNTRDLTAHGAYSMRAWASPPTQVGAPIAGLDSLLKATRDQIAEMDRAPRKPPPPDAPGGPLSKEAFDARAANLGPPRRLIVWTHPPDRAHPEIEAAGNTVTDMMRKAFSENPRYIVVSSDETINILAKTRDRENVARSARAELMVTIRGNTARDSLQWMVTAWDLTAYPTYEQRAVYSNKVLNVNAMAASDSAFRAVSKTLETLDRAPRRPPER